MRILMISILLVSLSIFVSSEDDKVYARCEVIEHTSSSWIEDKLFISDVGDVESLIIDKKIKRLFISDESGSSGFLYKHLSELSESYKNTFTDEYYYYVEEKVDSDSVTLKYLIEFHGVSGVLNFTVYYDFADEKEVNYSESKIYMCNKVNPI
tara:strand:- start:57 stop:515 length:459 start_codon:yes stop_codon:yes gene_type:complete